jgi:hypothetical protein
MAESPPLDLAVRLFADSGRQLRTWTTAFVAANGALFALLAVLVAWGDPAEDDLRLFNAILAAICLLGALASVMLGGAIYRQQRWGARLLGRIRALQDPLQPLLASNAAPPEGAFAAALTLAITVLISGAWIALLALIPLLGAVVETSVRA